VEALLDRDPDLIVLTYGWFGDETFEDARAALEVLPGAGDLTAVQEGRVFGLHYSQAEPQPQAIEGIELLAAWVAELT
jgi:ABC-type Fe3+-hydroxamate transport system substrate-binding protein